MSRTLTSFGRVVDVIYTDTHPRYKEMGGALSLYGVFYRILGRVIEEEGNEFLDFAYCGNLESNVPVKGEIIKLEVLPSEKGYTLFPSFKTYWTSITPLWNHPQHGILPDISKTGEQLQNPGLGFNLEELPEVKQVERRPGERVWEGRWGQYVKQGVYSGRFSQSETQDPFLEIETGPSQESSSKIVMTSNHTINTVLPSQDFTTHETPPQTPDQYRGAQTLIDSEYTTLIGKKQTLLSGGEFVDLTGGEVHVNGTQAVHVNGTKIYLGEQGARSESEPNLKGATTVTWLEELTEVVSRIITSLSAIPADPEIALPIIIQNNKALKETLPQLKGRLESLKSKKIFVE